MTFLRLDLAFIVEENHGLLLFSFRHVRDIHSDVSSYWAGWNIWCVI